MGVFRFKKFDVANERSAMKVNTDGVLLGAAMTVRQTDRRLLDIGTGTGTIALMAAQRLSGSDLPLERSISTIRRIDAIDIDEASASEASANFRTSSWSDLLHAHNLSLEAFEESMDREDRFDLIFSNPPYFEDSFQAPLERRNNARHTAATGLSYREILEFSQRYLSDEGRVAMVLPADQETHLARHARMCGLHMFRILRVRTVPRKAPVRMIAEFSRARVSEIREEMLTIQNEGKYTQEYLSLMHDFYLFA